MKFRKIIVGLFLGALIASAVSLPNLVQAQDGGDEDQPTEFHLRGTNVVTIGEYGDNFNYDGSNVNNQDWGFFEVHMDAENNVGLAFARFHVDEYQLDANTSLEDAVITAIYPLFGMPTATMPDYWEGGIADNVDLHGDSGQEAPVLPTVFNDVASWGPALLFINGEQYTGDEEFMGQPNRLGLVNGHIMYSDLVRDPETGMVPNADQSGPYNPAEPANGSVWDDEVSLLHLILRTNTRDTDNFPTFTMNLHVNFYDVEEIDPLEIDYLTWDMMADASPEDVTAFVGQVMGKIDEIQAEVVGEDMGDDGASTEDAGNNS